MNPVLIFVYACCSLTLNVCQSHLLGADSKPNNVGLPDREESKELLRLQESRIRELEKELEEYRQVHQFQSSIPKIRLDGDYDSQTRNAHSKRTDDNMPWEPVVSQLSQQLTVLTAEIQALKNSNAQYTQATGSVYTRWGHSACPNSIELVYNGYAGGTMYNAGSAATILCLPHVPTLEDHVVPHYGAADIYGAEYETCNEPTCDMSVACAVCRTPRTSTLMLPAAKACHAGWTLEYEGYLMGGYSSHAPSEFICVDRNMSYIEGTQGNDNGQLLYYAVVHCNSLSCPPYKDGKIVPCAFCSK